MHRELSTIPKLHQASKGPHPQTPVASLSAHSSKTAYHGRLNLKTPPILPSQPLKIDAITNHSGWLDFYGCFSAVRLPMA